MNYLKRQIFILNFFVFISFSDTFVTPRHTKAPSISEVKRESAFLFTILLLNKAISKYYFFIEVTLIVCFFNLRTIKILYKTFFIRLFIKFDDIYMILNKFWMPVSDFRFSSPRLVRLRSWRFPNTFDVGPDHQGVPSSG